MPNSIVPQSDATRRRERIKLLLGQMVDTQEKLLTIVTEAKDNDDHLALGYRSWTEYIKTEYAQLLTHLTREDRRFAAFALSQTGLSTRAIAPILGVSNKTVHQDVAGVTSGNTSTDWDVPQVSHGGAPDSDPEATPEQIPRMGGATEEQFEQSLAAARSQGDLSAENVARNVETITSEQKVVTGLDGKKYRRPESRVKPRNAPLPDSYRRAVYDLDKAMARVVRLTEDQRFAGHRSALADRSGRDLARIAKSLFQARKALAAGQIEQGVAR